MNLPYGYTNRTRLEGQTVIKTYSGADCTRRFLTELAVYKQLQGMSFMPELVSYDEDELTIITSYVGRGHGQDLLEENCDTVPFAIGKLAKELQLVRIDTIGEQQRAKSEVFVHGDFGPQNLLFAQKSFLIPYLVD